MQKTLLLCTILISTIVFARDHTVLDYTAEPGDNYAKAEFRLWYPSEIDYIKAVVVLTPGSNWDGRDAVNDSVWQAFAVEHHLGLLACYLTDKPHEQGFIEEYVDVSRGSGQALLNALNAFAMQAHHPELSSAPLLLWGMSAGGEFNYEFLAWQPERVLAFVVNKGGIYYSALLSRQARMVPGLLFVGEKDMAFRTDTIIGLFSVNRRAGAPWALVQEPNTAHATGRSRELALLLFADVLQLRLAGNEQNQLLPLHPDSGFLGDLKSHAISKIEPGKAHPDYPTAWLPTQRVAQCWRDIVTSGSPTVKSGQ